jgi:uncharacterized lipoprotein YbaY
MYVVTGTIVFGADLKPFVGGTVYVRLEDVSFADAPSHIVAESILRDVEVDGQALSRVKFTIGAPPLETRTRYVVRVHVDVDGDGQVGVGDYVSTASHPVSVDGSATKLLIAVKRVS